MTKKTPEQQRRDAEAYADLQRLLSEQALEVLLRDMPVKQPTRDRDRTDV